MLVDVPGGAHLYHGHLRGPAEPPHSCPFNSPLVTLEPVTNAGANFHMLMGYRYPGDTTKAAIELYPIAGKKVTAATAEAGLSASSIPTLLVEGDDRRGLGLAIAEAIAGAGINMAFFVAQAVGRRFSAVLGFEWEADAKAAAPLIKKATARKRPLHRMGNRPLVQEALGPFPKSGVYAWPRP